MAEVARNGFAARLVVREPLQDDIVTILSGTLSWEATLIQATLGENTLTVGYDVASDGAEWMLKECDVAVEVNTGTSGQWYEPDNCRFINLGSDRELTARFGSEVKGLFLPYSWILKQAVVYPAHNQKIDKKDLRTFRKTTPGGVMATLINEARDRGHLPEISTPWGTLNDAAGRSWGGFEVNAEFKVGTTLLEVLNQLIADGLCEARMNGRTLLLYKTWEQYPYTANKTVLRTGQDLLSADEHVDRSQRATHALLLGDQGQYIRHATSPVLTSTKWGPWEKTINLSGVKRTQLLTQGRKKLATMGDTLVSNKADIVFSLDSPWPFRDYSHGDYITINPANGPGIRVRVMEMRIGWNESGFNGTLTFGDRRLAPSTKLTNAVKKLSPTGVTVAGGGSPATATRPRPARHDVEALGAEANGFDLDDDAVAEIIPDMQAGDSFFVRPGSALTITSPLIFNNRTIVEGGGTIICRTPGIHAIRIGPGAHGSIIRDLYVNGTGYTTLATNSRAISLEGTSATDRLTDVVVDNVSINNWPQYGIYADLVENLEVTSCEISAIHYAAIGGLSWRRGRIIGNNIRTIQGLATNSNGYGIFLSRLSSFTETQRPVSSDVLVAFNEVRDVPTWEGLDTHAGNNIDFICNHVYNTRVGIAIVSGVNQAGVAAFGGKNNKVLGNTIDAQVDDGTRGPGIIVQGAGIVVGDWVDEATAIIANNFVRNHGLQAANINGGIQLYWNKNSKVLDNWIYQCSPGGVVPFHTNLGTAIDGNTLVDSWSTSYASPSGVIVPSNYNTGVVGNNRQSSGNKAAAFKNIYGLHVTPVNETNVMHEGGSNDFRQSVTQPWRDQSLLSENRFHANRVGFRGTFPIPKPAITGSKAGNAALASLITALANHGLVADQTT